MNVETKLMSADELLAMPDDGAHQYELVRGELITTSAAGFEHGVIAGRISAHLAAYVAPRRLGVIPSSDTGYLIERDPDTVLQPDASFVKAERVVNTRKYFPGPPDLAVEVISPSELYEDVDAKISAYIAAGTPMLIVVNPRKSALVATSGGRKRLSIDDSLTGGDVVPGWSLPLRDLFDAESQ